MTDRLLPNILSNINTGHYLIGRENILENIVPKIEVKIDGNLDWGKKTASLSINFKLGF